MKILITTDLFKPTINGVVTSVLNLEKELKAAGHEVRILTMSDRCSSYRDENVYYIRSVSGDVFYPDVRIPVSRGEEYVEELIRWQPDVVHSQCEFFSFGYARRIAKAADARLVHTYHTLYEQYTEYVPIGKTLSRAALGCLMRFRLKGVDRIVAPTEKVEQTLREYGIGLDIDIIPSGICLERFRQDISEETIAKLKQQYNIPPDKKVLLSLGRLGAEKRIDELIRGMKKLSEKRSDIILVIVGDGPARSELECLVKELGVEDFVRFTGMAKPEDVPKYYRLGDVFVCASTSETQGLTYIEAAASGLTLLCRKDQCLNGVLDDGKNGYAYETLEELADRAEEIIDNPFFEKRAKVHNKIVAAKYDTETFGEKIEACYENALGEVEDYESFVICEEQEDRIKKWSRACYGYARRVS